MECRFGGCLCYGPPVEDGFYYDTFLDGGEAITSDSFAPLEKICKEVRRQSVGAATDRSPSHHMHLRNRNRLRHPLRPAPTSYAHRLLSAQPLTMAGEQSLLMQDIHLPSVALVRRDPTDGRDAWR